MQEARQWEAESNVYRNHSIVYVKKGFLHYTSLRYVSVEMTSLKKPYKTITNNYFNIFIFNILSCKFCKISKES